MSQAGWCEWESLQVSIGCRRLLLDPRGHKNQRETCAEDVIAGRRIAHVKRIRFECDNQPSNFCHIIIIIIFPFQYIGRFIYATFAIAIIRTKGPDAQVHRENCASAPPAKSITKWETNTVLLRHEIQSTALNIDATHGMEAPMDRWCTEATELTKFRFDERHTDGLCHFGSNFPGIFVGLHYCCSNATRSYYLLSVIFVFQRTE